MLKEPNETLRLDFNHIFPFHSPSIRVLIMTQIEAKTLIDLPKVVEGGKIELSTRASYKLLPKVKGYEDQNFMIDVSRSSIILAKTTTQKRARKSIVLVRLDTEASHTNPPFSDEILSWVKDQNLLALMEEFSEYKYRKAPHIHIFIEPFAEKWAFPPEYFGISDYSTINVALMGFCDRFNIDRPKLVTGLF